ncbi:PA containing protein [Herbihabitans rhizosphaerae]|nr:PA containing protein [Herbihabitans rhizosphaerae]
MRTMLVRAAEIRESEQQQIFDALDEIHARMAPIETLGTIRKRLTEMSDRAEVVVLAERVDAVMSKLDSQDAAIAAVGRAVESIVDKLATPFAQLDGRLDGVAGRMEGVAGRMDGLEDKLLNIHRRLDELDGHLSKQDDRVAMVPGEVTVPVRERIEALEGGLRARIDEVDDRLHEHLDGTKDALHAAVNETRETVDASDRLNGLAERLEQVTSRLDSMTSRLDTVEDGFTAALGSLSGSIEQSLTKVEGTLTERPDSQSVESMVRKSNAESERRIGGHLDEAMATFAELMLGGGPAPQPPTTLPRQGTRRRTTKKAGTKNNSTDDADIA